MAFSDIRPTIRRKRAWRWRRSTAAEARDIELFEDYHKLLDRDDIEMVIIALPLHLHAAGAHRGHGEGQARPVREADGQDRERLQAMVRTARKSGAAGHRPPAPLQLPVRERAGGHRGRRTSWATSATSAPSGTATRPAAASPAPRTATSTPGSKVRPRTSTWTSRSTATRAWKSWCAGDCTTHRRGADGRTRQPPVGRLQHPAEGRARRKNGAVHPLAVSGVGVNSFFTDGREVEDHVFLTYEYPRRRGGDLLVDHHQRDRRLRRAGDGHARHAAVLAERDVYLFKEKTLKDTRMTWAERRIGQPSAVSTSTRWAAERRHAGHADQPRLPRGAGAPGLADPPSRPASRAATARWPWPTP